MEGPTGRTPPTHLRAGGAARGAPVQGTWTRVGFLAACVRKCESCAACHFVSYSRAASECGWFHTCNFSRLELLHGTRFRSVPVAKDRDALGVRQHIGGGGGGGMGDG